MTGGGRSDCAIFRDVRGLAGFSGNAAAAGRRTSVSLPFRVLELAGPDHRLADGPEQPVPGVEFADVVVDSGDESLVEFVPESADGAGA